MSLLFRQIIVLFYYVMIKSNLIIYNWAKAFNKKIEVNVLKSKVTYKGNNKSKEIIPMSTPNKVYPV